MAAATMKRETFPVKFEGGSYDLKRFMRDHPGGVNTLKVYEGKSISNAMLKFGHSASAYHMLSDLKVAGEADDLMNLTGELSVNGRIITNEEGTRDVEEKAFLEELEGRLDWSKPILSQLDAIAPHYAKWVNTAVYRNCRLFASPVIEALTYTPWYLVPVFWIPIIAYIGVTQYAEHVNCGDSCHEVPLSRLQFMYHLAVGPLIWSALEYTLHRWVFHLDPGSSLTMMKIHFVIHGMHHKVPFDSYRQVFPPIPAFGISCVLYTLVRPFMSYPMIKLAGSLAGLHESLGHISFTPIPRDRSTRRIGNKQGLVILLANVAAFLSIITLLRQMPTICMPRKKVWKLSREEVRSSFLGRVVSASDIQRHCDDRQALIEAKGYLTYDMIHYYVHHGSPKDGTYLYAMKRYHSNHHFVNHDKAFGISSKLWDYIFRTFVSVKKLSFSLNWNS